MATFPTAYQINFPQEEMKILDFWNSEKIFEKIQESRKRSYEANKGSIFSFYDGPPFATGLPHYGHILAGTIKDTITRFATQNHCYVERRFGWDCHGLPVEYEIDKRFEIRTAKDVDERMGGIVNYNHECRQIVMRYANEWETVVRRMGRWVDFENDYKTMYASYMESVWWVFKQIYSKGLVYKGTKVMPYSVGCQTPLSNFEAGQNYKEVTDVSITVAFNLHDSDEKLLIWTTTPWTLTANLAVCVNPNMEYVRLRDETSDGHTRTYILAKKRINYIFPEFSKSGRYSIVAEFKGAVLRDLKYQPPFDYYEKYGKKVRAFRVLVDTYIEDTVGTGIVHQAPYFGEDDYRVCLAHNIITNTSADVCPIDDNGLFTAEIPDLAGVFYKEANSMIIDKLTHRNMITKVEIVQHSYPFCWRSETPLIYKSVSCWFMRVQHMSDQLLQSSAATNWIPEIVKEKRFSNWLLQARDWAISRKRYWGTPIPIWTSECGDEIVCIGSLAELRAKTGVENITDMHRESIDHLTIPSARPQHPPLRRIAEVFDCWFESGAMPYGQAHYPFENEQRFHATFPADFIAEGIDQTRGWFYTLLVLSTALFECPAFRNVIVNGLVLAADGQKMSKRKQNYADPMAVIEKYGADALRLYLLNSALTRGGNLNFKEADVSNMVKCVLLPWYNALRFLLQNIERQENELLQIFNFNERQILDEENCDLIDIWMLSRNASFVKFVNEELRKYRLYAIPTALIEFIDDLTNWYVRLKRTKIKGEQGATECKRTLSIVFYVLLTLCKTMAAYMPFFSEYVYQQLARYMPEQFEINSVHNCDIPLQKAEFSNMKVEMLFQKFKRIVDLGRKLRERNNVPLKYPITEIVVLHTSQNYLNELKPLKSELLQELNCRYLTLSVDLKSYGVKIKVQPNHKLLGARLKNEYKIVCRAIRELSEAEIERAVVTKEIQILTHRIKTAQELHFSYELPHNTQTSTNYSFTHDNETMIAMDFTTTADMRAEGIVRELINRIQKLKKSAKLLPTDKVKVYYDLWLENDEEGDEDDDHQNDENSNNDDDDDDDNGNEFKMMAEIILRNAEIISKTIKSDLYKNTNDAADTLNDDCIIIQQLTNIRNTSFKFIICKAD